jgi:hypothetical protein
MSGDLDKTNFKDFAQKAIGQFQKDGLLIASLLWARIISLYEAELKEKDLELERAYAKIAYLEGNADDVPG